MRIEILDEALDDLAHGFQFYEQQESGIGAYFINSLYADIDSLRLYAGVHQKVFGFRRLLAKRFPFAIYYEVQSDCVQVYAVIDCRRSPIWIRRRLKN